MRSSAILLSVVAATAIASTVPLASAPAAPSRSFALLASLDRHSMVTVDARPKGTSPGDVFVFSTSLRRRGKLDGRAEFVQSVVDPRYRGVSMVRTPARAAASSSFPVAARHNASRSL